MDRGSLATPVDVLQAAVNRIVENSQKHEKPEAVKQPAKAEKPSFIAAARFQGAKPGYVFKKEEQGVGYYRDFSQALVEEEHPAPKAAQVVDADELLRRAEEETNADEIQLLDAKGLRRLINSFERKYKENMELRMKFADQPNKFMESEVDLDEQVKSLNQVAGYPELYPIFVESGVVALLLNLLTHENADIAADVIELFMEVTDGDILESSEEEGVALVDSMLEGNALELLVQRLTTLDESNPEEAQGVFNALSVLENMTEVQPSVAELMLERTKLLHWLLQRLKKKEFDSNRLYASEITAILLQSSEANQRRLGEMNGMEQLLMAIAQYKSKDPSQPQEQELLGNMFDVLCSALLLPENKAAFVKAEGIELMLLIVSQKRLARFGAIKVLDFATTRHPAACERVVDRQGLKYVFSLFMRKAKVKAGKTDKDWEAELDERLVSIVYNLFQGIAKGTRRERLAAKFVEQEFQKVDRLMELYLKYQKRVTAAESRLAREAIQLDLTPEEVLLTRLDEGLFVLQQCAFITASLWATGDPGLRKHLLKLLHQRNQTLTSIRELLLELYRSIGDDSAGGEEAAREKRRTGRVLAGLGVDVTAMEEEEQRQRQEMPPPAPAGMPAPPQPQPPTNGAANGDHDRDVDMEVDMGVDGSDAGPRERPPLPPPDADGAPAPLPPPPSSSGHAGSEEQERADRKRSERDRRDKERGDKERSDKERGDKDRKKERGDKERDKERGGERDKERGGDKDKERERQRDHRDHERKRERRDRDDGEGERSRHRSRKDDSDDERRARKRERRSPSP